MKRSLKAFARLNDRLKDYQQTVVTVKDSSGYTKPGKGMLNPTIGISPKKHRAKRTQDIHARMRDLSKKFPNDIDLRRYA